MDVYWLEQTDADVPAENDWLAAGEILRLNGLRFAKRRNDWRLGRWTAKRALALSLGMPANRKVFAEIEIRPAPSGAPEVYVGGQPAKLTISLSHRAGMAACAVARCRAELGCDLEAIEPRSDAFVADYFTAEEQGLAARAPAVDRFRLLALIWSAKESALKALHEGLRLDPRSVIVSPDHSTFDLHGWSPLEARHADGRVFRGWWQDADSMVRTLVAAPPPDPPIRLRIVDYVSDAASLCV
ncbi:MAG: 4'-phosphopantetheinyl transferase superfamily protein [Candidatus Sulfotelmatobacter sp.]